MKVKQVPVSEFKAHCSEELRQVEENEGLIIEITRHGKVIATVRAPENTSKIPSILGAGSETASFGPEYDPHEPAFHSEEWAMNQDQPNKK